MQWRHYCRSKSHDPVFLWRAVIAILLAGLVAGFAAQFAPRTRDAQPQQLGLASLYGDDDQVLAGVRQLLQEATDSPGFVRLLSGLGRVRTFSGDESISDDALLDSRFSGLFPGVAPQLIRDCLASAALPDGQQEIVLAYWQSLQIGEPTAELVKWATAPEPRRYANLTLGSVWDVREDNWEAAKAYEREGQFPEAVEARRLAVQKYLQTHDRDALERLADDPRYAAAMSLEARMEIAASRREWGKLWRIIPLAEWENLSWLPSLMAWATGIGWFVIALQMGEATVREGARWWLMLLAVPCGLASILVTHWLIYWQEINWAIVEDDASLMGGLRFFILGVGLREEFAKLLLFLPFVPWLARRGNDLETLLVAACVGLGFAVFENEGYFSASFGQSSIGRFLTANFFHMASTGVIGLAFVRGLAAPTTRLFEALTIFGIVVFAHGMYDATIVVKPMQDYAILASIIYILLSYQFFHELRHSRSDRQETISLTATFLGITSLLTSLSFVFLCVQFDWNTALNLLVPEVLSVALMAYMFLREMPNSLISL